MKRLTQARLKELLRYDRRSGVFFWRAYRRGPWKVGRAGCVNNAGYWRISVDGKSYLAHRLAWFYVYGYWPKQIDHKNRIKADNRIANLREANNSQNQANANKIVRAASGFMRVDKYYRKWRAVIKFNGKLIYIGLYDTPQAAHAAYCRAAKKLHGEYYRD